MRSEAEIREAQKGASILTSAYIEAGNTESEAFHCAAVIDDVLAWALGDKEASMRMEGMIPNLKLVKKRRKL